MAFVRSEIDVIPHIAWNPARQALTGLQWADTSSVPGDNNAPLKSQRHLWEKTPKSKQLLEIMLTDVKISLTHKKRRWKQGENKVKTSDTVFIHVIKSNPR